MKDYERIDHYPFVIYKVQQEYYIVDERTDMTWGIYKNINDAKSIASILNTDLERTQEIKLSNK